MDWHDIRDPKSPELDELAKRYNLHPLHIEDCRHRNQRAKVEEGPGYLFIVLKPVHLKTDCDLEIGDFDVFLGRDFIVTVLETDRPPEVLQKFDQAHAAVNGLGPDQLFYKLMDGLVDSYVPMLDQFSDLIDKIEDEVLESPSPEMLQSIFNVKRNLIEMRRVLANMRDVAGHLQRTENDLIRPELVPFLRDVYDHLARNLDMVETYRDLLSGALDIYLSSVANRTNETMKALTIMGTVAIPAIVISGFFGMNTADLPLAHSRWGTEVALALMAIGTIVLLWFLKRRDWW